jgi:hypothetical protein
LRALKYELDLQSANVSDPIDVTMLAAIRDNFSLLHWSEEVRLTLSTGTNKAACENLIRTLTPAYPSLMSQKTDFIRAGEAQAEWSQLISLLEEATKLAAEGEQCTAVIAHAKSASGEFIQSNMRTDSASDISSITDPNSVVHFVQAVQSWKTALGDVATTITNLLGRISQSRITLPDVTDTLQGCLKLINLVETVSMKVAAIRMAMLPSDEATSVSSATSAHSQVVNLKDLTLLAQTAALSSDEEPDFLLLLELSNTIGALLQEANRWNENTQTLLPNKTTRNKTKSDAKATTKRQLELVLLEPIARAVRIM